MRRRIFISLVLLLVGLRPAAAERPAATVIERDVVYCEREDVALKLDIYRPAGDGPFSAVLVVHGGAWRLGTRTQLQGYAEALAKRGHCCFAISYRLAPRHKFPAQIEDCRTAVAWIRQNAAKYHVDRKRVGAIGYSAGGHLVALLGTTGKAPDANNGGVDTRLQAVAAGGAPCDFRSMPDGGEGLAYWLGGSYDQQRENFVNASPVVFASADDAPTLFFNGTKDQIVPLEWTLPLYKRLQAAGVKVVLHRVEGANHFGAAMNQEALSAAYDFLDQHLAVRDRTVDTPAAQPATIDAE
jgi:triacylglycerol lipase